MYIQPTICYAEAQPVAGVDDIATHLQTAYIAHVPDGQPPMLIKQMDHMCTMLDNLEFIRRR